MYLPIEIWEIIMSFMTLKDSFSVYCITSSNNRNIKDTIFRINAIKYRGLEFWERANRRNKKISKPLGSYREEVLRMLRFENSISMELKNEDYYSLWEIDKTIKKYK